MNRPENMPISILTPAACLALAALAGCTTQPQYIEADRLPIGAGHGIGRDWITPELMQLGNRGHDYKASQKQVFAAVKKTLARFGLRASRRSGEWGIASTYPSKSPRVVTQALLNKYNRRMPGAAALALHYTVQVSVWQPPSKPVTNVNLVVYPEVLLPDGRTWIGIPSDGTIRKAFFKDLDTRLPVYRLKGDTMWRRW